jgi:hypothetical protein
MRWVLLAEVASQKHASAFVGLSIIGDSLEAALAFVAKCL